MTDARRRRQDRCQPRKVAAPSRRRDADRRRQFERASRACCWGGGASTWCSCRAAMCFPGGRVDPGDRQDRGRARSGAGQSRGSLLVAMKGHPSPVAGAGAGAGRGARDLRGGGPADRHAARRTAAPPRAQAWQEFFAHGYRPALAQLTFFARAITPPGRPRRFDTRFFCVPAEAIVSQDRDCRRRAFRPRVAFDRRRPAAWNCPISRGWCWRIWASGSRRARCDKCDLPVPFYHRRNGNFHRDLITRRLPT